MNRAAFNQEIGEEGVEKFLDRFVDYSPEYPSRQEYWISVRVCYKIYTLCFRHKAKVIAELPDTPDTSDWNPETRYKFTRRAQEWGLERSNRVLDGKSQVVFLRCQPTERFAELYAFLNHIDKRGSDLEEFSDIFGVDDYTQEVRERFGQ